MLIRTIDQIIAERKQDILLVEFRPALTSDALLKTDRQRQFDRHVEWFEANGLAYELAAPRGWMGGDPAILAVHFDGRNDPRIASYSAEFEDESGRSLAPGEYQMVVLPYDAWCRRNGRTA